MVTSDGHHQQKVSQLEPVLKGGLALFSILARLRRTRLSSTRKTEVFSNRKAIDLAIKETLSYGIFLGTFAGTYVSVDEIIAYLGGHGRTAKWRSLLAGLIAGPSMLLTGPNTQHTSLAIYILMRAAVLASRSYHQMVNIDMHQSAYILKQDSLPPSYKSFLNKHGGKNLSILEDPEMKIPCTMIHGNQSCSAHVVSFFLQAFKRALPVYLPVYLIPALIVHRQGLLK
ncbi:hypothetical protein OIU77_025483, partial [Salix suchowensis]